MALLVFDSGIGGLGVVAALRQLQPAVPLVYLADNAGFPYGEQPDQVLLRRVVALLGDAIARLRPEAVVIACNTASTIALGALRAYGETPFIGCVPPVKPAAAASRSRHVGLLATPATIRRPYLQSLIDEFADGCTVHPLGTPVLAELAEAKFRGQPVDLETLAGAIAPLFAQPQADRIDAIALGCTHYTFLLPELRAMYPAIGFFDPARPVARQALAVAPPLSPAPEPTAWFTAAPPDPVALQGHLAAYGFMKLAQLKPPVRVLS